MVRLGSVIVVVALTLLGCAPDDSGPIGGPIFDGTTPEGERVDPPITTLPAPDVDALRVPFEYFTIQEAVNAAQPGDLVLVDPGVYSEEITITSADVIVRGRDRETVFVDGLHSLTNGIRILADGVAIENLTVRNYTLDGISIGEEAATGSPGVNRSRIELVTTSNTGRHGIVARRATSVDVTQVWTSGHGGAGVSIENCSPCDTVIQGSVAEFSARGFSLTGTAGPISVVTSSVRNNRVGIFVADGEHTTSNVQIVGNSVLNNGFSNTPIIDVTWDHSYGAGIHVVGTTGTALLRNRISGNIGTGVLVGSTAAAPIPAVDIEVEGNVIALHPSGEIVDVSVGQQWQPIESPTFIPYVNGPVPQGITGMTDPDLEPGVPAGAVQQPALDGVVVPPA